MGIAVRSSCPANARSVGLKPQALFAIVQLNWIAVYLTWKNTVSYIA